jgi:hypothetical protein
LSKEIKEKKRKRVGPGTRDLSHISVLRLRVWPEARILLLDHPGARMINASVAKYMILAVVNVWC